MTVPSAKCQSSHFFKRLQGVLTNEALGCIFAPVGCSDTQSLDTAIPNFHLGGCASQPGLARSSLAFGAIAAE